MAEGATRADTTPALSLEGLSRHFGDFRALDDVSLRIGEGEFFTVVGPSGSGKTTLLRILAGLDRPTKGRLMLRGRDVTRVPANRRPTAMVFQSLALFDHRSVGQNVEFAMKMRGDPPDKRREEALRLLELVRLGADYYDRAVTQCSGGERQRVALARALASDPEILFFDEPLSALDFRLRKTLEIELRDLQKRTGRTFVYITHSLEEAMVMSDRIGIMRNGKLVQVGPPDEIYGRPRDRFVARFMGEVNIFDLAGGRIEGLGDALDAEGHLVLRPEALRLAEGEMPVTFDGNITDVYHLGSRVHLHVDSPAGQLISELPAPIAVAAGETRRFGFDPAEGHVVRE
jgi:spermidine/putrescine transport system ATP-binding protein